jgi:cytochrome c peroxidase
MVNRTVFAYIAVGVAALLIMAFVGDVLAQSPALLPKEELGKAIFFDKSLSINQNQACAACHAPEAGWAGPDEAVNKSGSVYEGSIAGRFGNRKPPSSAYATLSPVFNEEEPGLFVGGNFWDGRATGHKLGNPAADQAQGPFLNPAEQAMPEAGCVVYRVCDALYPVTFESVWGSGTCDIKWPDDIETVCTKGGKVALSAEDFAKSDQAYDNIALSIAAFESSSESNAFTSKFDYFLQGKAELTEEESEGYALFDGRAKCSKCHVASGEKPLFTDYTYDNLGIPKNPDNPATKADANYVDPGLGGYLKSTGAEAAVYEPQMGKFKVPTVRNVDKRPTEGFVSNYGHNGYFKSLEQIVHFYNTRDVLPSVCDSIGNPQPGVNCWPAPETSANINDTELGNLGLTPEEEAAIVAFLKTLTDDYKP